MLDKKIEEEVRKIFEGLEKNVKLLVFTQDVECMYCEQNEELVRDISALTDKITFEVYDFVKDSEIVKKYGIDKIPAIVPLDEDGRDYSIRFFGIPSGYEFSSLLESIKLLSTGNHGLSDDTVKKIEGLQVPVHLQVYVTPTCPYCPRAVVLSHKLAYVSDRIRGDMVEAIEFPHLANKYNVMGVPKTIINEKDYIEGAVPEPVFVDKILKSIES